MIVHPRTWGFICTTAHPFGCEQNVRDQVNAAHRFGAHCRGPRNVLVIGASSGYGLAARITAAFRFGAQTLGIFHEKPPTSRKLGSAGWYNAAAFDRLAKESGLRSVSINGDAFSDAVRECAIQAARERMSGPIDLVIYSLAAPMRRLPDSGECLRTALKPIGRSFSSMTIDTDRDQLVPITVEAATEKEISDTTAIMGGDNWVLWLHALAEAGLLAPGASTVAFSYIGPPATWPIYRNGTIGRAKVQLEACAADLCQRFGDPNFARVAVLKSIVTQASAAIPVIPLYLSLLFKVMKDTGLHEGAIEQQTRLFDEHLYPRDGQAPVTDDKNRLRLDDRELCDEVQSACAALWPKITDENLFDVTDYSGYKGEFLRLFGFARNDIDYEAEVQTEIEFDCLRP